MKTKSHNEGMPGEVIAPVSLQSFLATLLGTVLLVLLINFMSLWYLSEYTPRRGFWLITEKWNKLITLKEPVDWLILGDSTGNSGVIPRILKDRLGGNALNLCTISPVLVINDVWMLETYINRFGAPKNLIIVHSSEIWPWENLFHEFFARIPLKWGFWSQYEPKLKLHTKEKIEMFLHRYIPLYGDQDSLYKIIGKALTRPRSIFTVDFRLEPDGFMRHDNPDITTVESHTRRLIELAKKNQSRFTISAINQKALERIIDLADLYKINTYIACSPVHEGLYRNEFFHSYYETVQSMLQSYADRSEWVHHLKMSITFPRNQFYSADHIIYSAAKVYTEILVNEILTIEQRVGILSRPGI
jgi:hypothetical protein